MTEFSADTDDLAHFVDRGRAYLVRLEDLLDGLNRKRAVVRATIGHDLGPVDRVSSTLRELVTEVGLDNAMVAAIGEALADHRRIAAPTGGQALQAILAERYGPSPRWAVLDGRTPPPDDRLRDRVVQAMLAGRGPGDGPGDGIDRAYFPADYLRHRELNRQIEGLAVRRERADGSSWSPWDGDRAAMAEIDQELDRLGALRDRVAAGFPIADDGTVGHLDAIHAVAATTGGSRWEGTSYGDAFNGYHETRVSRGLLGGEALREPTGYGVELTHMAERVADDPAVAVAFYNTLGARRTGDLVTLAVGNGLDRTDLDRFGRGLAAASRQTGPGGGRLAFGGDDLLGLPRPVTEPGVVGYSPALLFTDGRFGPEFLAGAATTALRLANGGDPRGFTSHFAQAPTLGPGELAISYDGGADPRNILLARAAERPEVARAVVDRLVPREWRAPYRRHPEEGPLAALLEPTVPFPLPEDAVLERDRAVERLGSMGYPGPLNPSPITAFLRAVGADGEAARWVLLAAARAIEERGPIVQNEATAAGLDLILAAHATAVFRPGALEAVGIEPSGLNDRAPVAVDSDRWRAVHGEVLRHGRGQALAWATDSLVSRAIVGAIDDDGRFHAGKTRPFAHLAARVQAETYEASYTHAASLDEAAERRNRTVSAVVGMGIGSIGFVSGSAGLVAGLVGWGAGGGWSWFFDGHDTDHEIRERREKWIAEYYLRDPARWEKEVGAASLMARSRAGGEGRIDLVVPGRGPRNVPFRRRGETAAAGFEWRDPRTGAWSPIPDPDLRGFHELFPAYDPPFDRQVNSAASSLSEDYQDGIVTAAARSRRFEELLREAEQATAPANLGQAAIADATADAGWTDGWVARA